MFAFFAMIVSIQPRTRFAVSRLVSQMGSSNSWMWLGLIYATVSFPMVG